VPLWCLLPALLPLPMIIQYVARLSTFVNIAMPLHRKIIHDSDCDSPSPVPHAGTAHDPCPSPKLSIPVNEGVVVFISSDSSDGSDSEAAPFHVMTSLQFAGKFGRFPGPEDSAMVTTAVEVEDQHVADGSDGYLWNAVPPSSSQYLDLEAVCVDDSSSGTSGDSEGELSPGFVDDDAAGDAAMSPADMELLKSHFPHTWR
jgi:hypothetical protein